MAEVTLKVEGMSCQHCVGSVKKALDSLDGINSSDVEIGSVKVTYDEAKTDRKAIEETIQNAGYKVVL